MATKKISKTIELENRIAGCERAIQKLSEAIGRIHLAFHGVLSGMQELTKLEEKRSGGTKTKISGDLN